MSTTVEAPASTPRPARPRAEVLRRADGIELIGEFEDSGLKEPPLLARRADGQVVQLTDMLYAVAEAADGRRDLDAIADAVGDRCGRPVNAANVKLLADKKLRPLGVLALADGTTPELEKREPLMALRHRRPLLSERTVNAGARPLTWLHRPFVTIAVVLAVVVFDVWLFGMHGIAGGLRAAIYNPALLLAVLASVIVATAFHEFGHASACRYSGARPGVMGVGVYLVWPAFYCDVTDAYRLSRAGRLRTDLGGVYFNAISVLVAGAVFFATGEEAALLAAVVQHMIMFQQLLPLLRFDGYYVLSDLTGVPDILERIKPIFRSLVRGRRREPRVAELKPRVRVVVTAYIVLLLPTLFFMFAWMVMGAPRLLATVHDSFGLQVDRILAAAGPAEAGVGVVRMLALLMPFAAMSLSLVRTTRMAGRGLARWSRGSTPRRLVACTGAVAVVAAVGYIWLPNGDYQPIRPGERGTVGELVSSIPDVVGGRPSYTPEYEQQYGQVPTDREAEAAERAARRGERPGEQAPPENEEPLDERPVLPEGTSDAERSPLDDSVGLGVQGAPDDYGQGYDSGGTSSPSGSAPPPGGTTTSPSDGGTTTTAPPPPGTDGTSTTQSEPAPTTTETTPTTTETTPTEPPPDTTETTPTAPAPDGADTSTTTDPLSELDTTNTTPETTTTTPDTTTTSPTP